MDSSLRPRDIQARIRAGESPEAVAQAAQTSIEKIMVYAGPVLAEREHIADRAQRSTVRRTTGESAGGARTLGDAVERLQDYLALMAVRMGPRLQVRLAVPDVLKSQPVLPLLLQPLVENAIRHGLEPQIDGGTIALQAQRDGDQLVLTLSDTGAGGAAFREASPHSGPHTGGLGLAHVRERLHTRYGAAAHMALHSPPGHGTRITLQWPLQH